MAAVVKSDGILRFTHRWNEKKMRHGVSMAPPMLRCRSTMDPEHRPLSNHNLEIMKSTREKFIQEVSFNDKNDEDISLAKALLYVAAEDEAYVAFNRELDALSYRNGRNDAKFEAQLEYATVEEISLAGKSISGWLNELDIIAEQVEAELVSRGTGCHQVEVLKAINVVLFELRGFKRFHELAESKFSYLHTLLSSGSGSAILLNIIYIEICRKLSISIVGSYVGEDFLIWPQTWNLEELFNASSGQSLFSIVNGRCVQDPRSKASDVNNKSRLALDIATNRYIILITLADLVRLHWKCASRSCPGVMLNSPLGIIYSGKGKDFLMESSNFPLLRPQELRV